ncbi:hypothetical protein [Nonomuraea sp. LPB2021202275-12-8]|uniref:hypothetical protein n=1 Tax=Nonomuraea sp. LPB2021202275-12-8 TaxID=3120159 RepID=UPI00300CB97C
MHQHLEYRSPGQYGFTQTVPTWLTNAEVPVPPGDVPLAYAMTLYIPPGQECTSVAIAMRGFTDSAGTIQAGVYQNLAGVMLPIGITDPTTVMWDSAWHSAHFPAPIAASDDLRKVKVVVSVANATDAVVMTFAPNGFAGPFMHLLASDVSTQVTELPAVLNMSAPAWRPFDQFPIIALA